MPSRVAVVLKGYPRLSETFIAQEIRALERLGFELCIISLRRPHDPATHPIHAEIEAPVLYLPEYLRDDLPRVLRALLQTCWKPGFWRALTVFLLDLGRDRTRSRLRRFGQALVMARETPATVRHYHTHFMHTPASVSYYACMMNHMSWSLSAHAKDIWTIPQWEIREKLASVDWIVTCTGVNHRYLSGLSDGGVPIELVYHGLDFTRFTPNPQASSKRDGRAIDRAVSLLSVGRAVDKKGYEFLLEALAALPPELHWRFVHIGAGELLARLRQRARELGIDENIEWRGALPQTDVLSSYRAADLFVLPSRISDDGDRDGLPNVLMEAQSQRLACLSTAVSGIPELILHAQTGWLVEQNDAGALRRALEILIRDPALRNRLGQAGFERVRQHFSMEAGVDAIARQLQNSLERVHRR